MAKRRFLVVWTIFWVCLALLSSLYAQEDLPTIVKKIHLIEITASVIELGMPR